MPQVSNDEFLAAIFSDPEPATFLWCAAVPGDPKQADGKFWAGGPVKPRALLRLDGTRNTYFNLATVKEYNGKVARKDGNFDALWVVVLDDVGTKGHSLPADVEPTYLLETSPGNYQAGFKLATPCSNLGVAQAVYKALITKELSDPGFGGPQSRYARLPVGVNHKEKCGPGGFPTSLAIWNPACVFTIEQIVSIFGLDLVIEEAVNEQPTAGKRPACNEVNAPDDEKIINTVQRSAKGRRAWDGDDGDNDGSAVDQYLLNLIAFKTEDAEQVERIYGMSPRADRVSSDGTRKWRTRSDYRKRSIEKAFKYVGSHPDGDTDDAREVVEAAIASAKATADCRAVYAEDAIRSLAILKKGDPGNYDHLRRQAKKAGATMATLDAEINRAAQAESVSHDEAADLAIAKLGGRESIVCKRGRFSQWRQERGIWQHLDSDEAIKKIIHSVLPRQQINAGTVGSVLSVLRTKVARDDVVFDAPRPEVFVACHSGTLYLKEGDYLDNYAQESWWELRPHRREDFLTAIVPVAWDEGAQCPRFEKFLDDVTECDSDGEPKRRLLVEAIGYSLTQMTSEERFVVLYGETSNNGKSTFLRVLEALAGKENTSALNLQQLGERFGLAGLEGKLVNLCAEVARGVVLPDDSIKKLTSGDTITVERKGKDHHEIKPFATLWFATNALPNLRDLSPAILEKRCVLIEFNRSFKGEDRDTRLIEKLQAELPGIFWMCVETFGASLALSRTPSIWTTVGGVFEPVAYFDCLMHDPPSSTRAKAAWRKDSDPVQQFADECLVQGSDQYVPAANLYAAWLAWAEANGVRLSLSSRVLTGRLGKMFPKVATGDDARQGRTRGVRGLGLVEATA